MSTEDPAFWHARQILPEGCDAAELISASPFFETERVCRLASCCTKQEISDCALAMISDLREVWSYAWQFGSPTTGLPLEDLEAKGCGLEKPRGRAFQDGFGIFDSGSNQQSCRVSFVDPTGQTVDPGE